MSRAVAVLLRQLAALTDTIAHLHAMGNRLAQTEAAAVASTQLRRAHCAIEDHGGADPSLRAGHNAPDPDVATSTSPPSAVAIAQLDFPCPPVTRQEGLATDPTDPSLNRVGVRTSRGPRR